MILESHQVHPSLVKDHDFPDVVEVRTTFNLHKLQKALLDLVSSYKLACKDDIEGYEGIALQASQNSTDPLYESVQSNLDELGRIKITQDYPIHKNSAGKAFDFIFSEFKNCNLMRGRILRSWPNMQHYKHSDGPGSRRLHIPVNSTPGAEILINEKPYHLKANGNGYIVNTEKEHYIRNTSSQPRDHIIFDL